jgi:riboflavin synthase
MFTGIVREIGNMSAVERRDDILHLTIECPGIRPGIAEGDSIAVEGCDLTAAALTQTGFRCDVTKETLARTTLGELRAGSKVNLEPSLTPSTPISGHFVLGHIDGVGTIRSLKRGGDQAELVVAAPLELMKFIAQKGSIAISGVGLTVVVVLHDSFSCWLIPYTLEHTTLGSVRSGGKVNLEVDVLARYIVRALEAGVKPVGETITEEFLQEHGFGS